MKKCRVDVTMAMANTDSLLASWDGKGQMVQTTQTDSPHKADKNPGIL